MSAFDENMIKIDNLQMLFNKEIDDIQLNIKAIAEEKEEEILELTQVVADQNDLIDQLEKEIERLSKPPVPIPEDPEPEPEPVQINTIDASTNAIIVSWKGMVEKVGIKPTHGYLPIHAEKFFDIPSNDRSFQFKDLNPNWDYTVSLYKANSSVASANIKTKPSIIVGDSGKPLGVNESPVSGTTYQGDFVNRIISLKPNTTDISFIKSRFNDSAIRSNDGVVKNITVKECEFLNFKPGKLGNSDFNAPIWFTMHNNGTKIIDCNFHDYNAYGFRLYWPDNFLISGNRFFNLRQGGHSEGTYRNCTLENNTYEQISRMAFETQDQYKNPNSVKCENLIVRNNVAKNWKNPSHLSYAFSLMTHYATGMIFENNEVSFDYTGTMDQRFGLLLELDGEGSISRNNTYKLVTPKIGVGIAVAARNARIQNEKFYGPKPAGEPYSVWIKSWPSRGQSGSWTEENIYYENK